MDDLYRDYILEHYRRPHNFGVIEDADASYEGANPLCGDRITLMLGVKDGVVDRVGFTGRGCAISQASASLLTDEIKGKPHRRGRRDSARTTCWTCSGSTSARPASSARCSATTRCSTCSGTSAPPRRDAAATPAEAQS